MLDDHAFTFKESKTLQWDKEEAFFKFCKMKDFLLVSSTENSSD